MTSPMTASPADLLGDLADTVLPAAVAAAAALPSAVPLSPAAPQTPADLDLAGWPAASVATLTTNSGASVAVLVRAELVDALASAPEGGLDVGAALQPVLDAAAAALGAAAGAGRTLAGADLAALVGSATVAVPLVAGTDTTAVLVLTTSVAPGGTGTAGAPRPVGLAGARGVELLHGVAMEVTVELGRTQLSVRELLGLCPGDVLELDRAAGSPADLLVNGRLIARGEVVVVDENFALRVTEIVAQPHAG